MCAQPQTISLSLSLSLSLIGMNVKVASNIHSLILSLSQTQIHPNSGADKYLSLSFRHSLTCLIHSNNCHFLFLATTTRCPFFIISVLCLIPKNFCRCDEMLAESSLCNIEFSLQHFLIGQVSASSFFIFRLFKSVDSRPSKQLTVSDQ